jgi:hypothetical protein
LQQVILPHFRKITKHFKNVAHCYRPELLTAVRLGLLHKM